MENEQQNTEVEQQPIVRFHTMIAGKTKYKRREPGYKSRFGRDWWFWLPRIHLQKPEILGTWSNPRVVRFLWLCFAVGADIGYDGPIK